VNCWLRRRWNGRRGPGLVPPAGFRLAALSEGLTGTALVGQEVLYRWPVDDWVRGINAPSRHSLVWIPFSRTTVMGLPADGPDTGHQLQTGND
jgi:hypothetical protein